MWDTRELKQIILTALTKKPTFHGFSDKSLKDIPIVTMGAGDRQVPHQVDEWVDLDQLVETAKIYALTALHYLSPKKEDMRTTIG